MGVYDNFYIEKNTFLFPESFFKRHRDLPVSDKKGNLELYYQSTDIDYCEPAIYKSLEDKLGHSLEYGIHDLSLEIGKDNLLNLYFSHNTNRNKSLNPRLHLDFVTTYFEIPYISDCEDLTSYRYEPKLDEVKYKYYNDMFDKYGNLALFIDVNKGIVDRVAITKLNDIDTSICELSINTGEK